MLRRGLMKFVDREPVAAISLGLGLFGFSLPFIVPPIRQSMGFCTKQVCVVRVVLVDSSILLYSEPAYVCCSVIWYATLAERSSGFDRDGSG